MTQYYWISQIKYNKTILKHILKIYWIPDKIHAIKYQADNILIMILSYKWIAIKNKILYIKKVKIMNWMNFAKIIELTKKLMKFLIMLLKI